MPLYEYQCAECNHVFEHLTRPSSESRPRCPKCGKDEATKLMSASAVNVKEAAPRNPGCGGCAGSASCPYRDSD